MTSLNPSRIGARAVVLGLLVVSLGLNAVMAQEGEPEAQVYEAPPRGSFETPRKEGGPPPLYVVPMRPLLASAPARLALIEQLSMIISQYSAERFEARDVELYTGPQAGLERPHPIDMLSLSTLPEKGCNAIVGFLRLDKFWSQDLPINYDSNARTADPALCVRVGVKDTPEAQSLTFAQRPAVIRFSGRSVLMLSNVDINGSAKNVNTPRAETEPDRVTDWLFPVVLVADVVFSLGCGTSQSTQGTADKRLPNDYCTRLQDELISAYSVLTVFGY